MSLFFLTNTRRLDEISKKLDRISKQMADDKADILAAVAAVSTDLDGISADSDAVLALVQKLEGEVAAGGTPDLSDLKAAAMALQSKADAAKGKLDTVAAS